MTDPCASSSAYSWHCRRRSRPSWHSRHTGATRAAWSGSSRRARCSRSSLAAAAAAAATSQFPGHRAIAIASCTVLQQQLLPASVLVTVSFALSQLSLPLTNVPNTASSALCHDCCCHLPLSHHHKLCTVLQELERDLERVKQASQKGMAALIKHLYTHHPPRKAKYKEPDMSSDKGAVQVPPAAALSACRIDSRLWAAADPAVPCRQPCGTTIRTATVCPGSSCLQPAASVCMHLSDGCCCLPALRWSCNEAMLLSGEAVALAGVVTSDDDRWVYPSAACLRAAPIQPADQNAACASTSSARRRQSTSTWPT